MLDLNDDHWVTMQGGYRVPYDPRPAFAKLESSEDVSAAWDELWNELHHQGDLGEASYAAIPHLVRIHRTRDAPDWNTYALAGIVEIERESARNPDLPPYLQAGYHNAWKQLPELALRDLGRSTDDVLVRASLGVVALGRGLRAYGELLLGFTDGELKEMMEQYLGDDGKAS